MDKVQDEMPAGRAATRDTASQSGGGVEPLVMSQSCRAWRDWLTQAGQRHGRQVDGLHGVGPLVQRPHELEVEDAADQAADAAGGEEDHLGGAERGGQSEGRR